VTCQEIQMLMLDELKGDLDGSSLKALESHRLHCPACQAEWEDLRETWGDLEKLPEEAPSPALREAFRRMLKVEGVKIEPSTNGHRLSRLFNHPVLQIAAVVLLVLGGFSLGLRSGFKGMEVQDPNRAMLTRTSVRERLVGVAIISQSRRPDPSLASSLLDLVERDPEVQVRLSAVEALYLFDDQPEVRERLAQNLGRQASPQVQLAIVDLLSSLREKHATEALKKLLLENHLAPDVRRRVRRNLDAKDGPAL